MHRRALSIVAMLLVGNLYSSAFAYLFNAIGATTTAALVYRDHKQRKDAVRNALRNAQEVDQVTREHVINLARQMPDVSSENIESLKIYRGNRNDNPAYPGGAIIQNSRTEPCHLFVRNWHINCSPLHDAQQYMALAHELGHVHHEDDKRQFWKCNAYALVSGCVYPCISYIATSCVRHPYIRAAMFPVILGVTTLSHMVSWFGWSQYQARTFEREADMFALRQARSLHDINAFYKIHEEDAENEKEFLKEMHLPWIGHGLLSHPHPEERMRYTNAYYRQKENEGLK